MINLLAFPAWVDLLMGLVVTAGVTLEAKIYPLPEPGDPTNTGLRWLFNTALAASQWICILFSGCLMAFALIRMSVGLW